MKRCIAFVVVLLLLTIGMMFLNDRINVALVLSSTGNSAYKTYRLFSEKPRHEIAILGSSRACAHFVPSLLSPYAFNYGVDGSGMYETLTMLERALQNPYPSPIIVNLDPWGFHGEITASFVADYTLVRDAPMEQPWEKTMPGIRFHGALRNNLASWFNGQRAVTKRIEQGAILQLLSRTPEEWQIINRKIMSSTFSYDSSWDAFLERCRATKAHPIVWVVGPTAPAWRAKYQGDEARKAFCERLKVQPHTYVIDLYDVTKDYTEAAFVDPTHLNIEGAKRFTALLKRALEALPIQL